MGYFNQWPEHEIDHRDKNPLNNAFENLRPATHAQNHQNISLRSDNTSGYRGVAWDKQASKWTAYINVEGRKRHLRYFATKEAAVAARFEAQRALYPFA